VTVQSIAEPDITLAGRLFGELARGTRAGRGIVRDSYGPGEQFAHDLIAATGRDLGLEVGHDAALNTYVTLPGRDPAAPAVVMGSHLDSVMQGGNFDGAAGVVAGMAVLAGFVQAGVRPPVPLTVMGIRAEESVWFDWGYIGSSAALGRLDPAALDVRRSDNGRTLAEHLAELGGDVAALRAGRGQLSAVNVSRYLEVHIEQGPQLVDAGLPLGIVTGIRGCARYSAARVEGVYAHSGATPRAYRRDAVLAAAEFVAAMDAVWERREAAGEDLCVTVGVLATDPAVAAGSKVSGAVRFVLDVRSTSEATMRAVGAEAVDLAADIGVRRGVRIDLGSPTWSPAAVMAPDLQAGLTAAARRLGIPHQAMASGAGHDAAAFAGAGIPSAMLFIRNDRGSHNADEAMDLDDFAAACRVLSAWLQEG